MDTRDFLEKYAVKAEGPPIPRAREVASWSDVKPLRRFQPGAFPEGPFLISVFDEYVRLIAGPFRLIPTTGSDPNKLYFEPVIIAWIHETTAIAQYQVFNESGEFGRFNILRQTIVLKKGDHLTLDVVLTP